MDKKRVGQIKEQFDLVIHSDETAKIEFWYARDLMSLLGYERWENFDKAILQSKLRELTELALESGEGNEGDEE